MNAEDLIETIQASGVTSADEIKSVLEDGYILSLIFELPDFDPDDAESVAQHAEAQAIAEEAYSLL